MISCGHPSVPAFGGAALQPELLTAPECLIKVTLITRTWVAVISFGCCCCCTFFPSFCRVLTAVHLHHAHGVTRNHRTFTNDLSPQRVKSRTSTISLDRCCSVENNNCRLQQQSIIAFTDRHCTAYALYPLFYSLKSNFIVKFFQGQTEECKCCFSLGSM